MKLGVKGFIVLIDVSVFCIRVLYFSDKVVVVNNIYLVLSSISHFLKASTINLTLICILFFTFSSKK